MKPWRAHARALRWRWLAAPLAAASCAAPSADAPSAVVPPRVVEPVPAHTSAAPAFASTGSGPSTDASASLAKQLAAIRVPARLPDVAAKVEVEVISPATVEAVVTRAEADMFVTYVANEARTLPDFDVRLVDNGHFPPYPDSDIQPGPLAAYQGWTAVAYAPGASDFILTVQVHLDALRDRTPGLIWSVDSTAKHPTVTFLSLDGEIYSFSLGPGSASVAPGVDPPASWPKPVNQLFGRTALGGRRTQVAALDREDRAIEACAKRVSARIRRGMTPEQLEAYPWPPMPLIRSGCSAELAAWERTFVENVEADVARRTALLDKARARVVALGIAR